MKCVYVCSDLYMKLHTELGCLWINVICCLLLLASLAASYCENDLDVLWYVRVHVNDDL